MIAVTTEIEASRALHAAALKESRPGLEPYFEPIGALAVVHNVLVIAAPNNEAVLHMVANEILQKRLAELEPDIDEGLEIMWKTMPLKQKIPLFMRRIPSELDAVESRYRWNKSLEAVSQPLGNAEIET